MEDPKIIVKVIHSKSKPAWNIVSDELGKKHKIAQLPYLVIEGAKLMTEIEKSEALKQAKFIEYCFNNSNKIIKG